MELTSGVLYKGNAYGRNWTGRVAFCRAMRWFYLKNEGIFLCGSVQTMLDAHRRSGDNRNAAVRLGYPRFKSSRPFSAVRLDQILQIPFPANPGESGK